MKYLHIKVRIHQCILLAGLALATDVSAEDVSNQANETLETVFGSAHTYEPAEIIARDAPRYPERERQRYREAWVVVSYCIDEAGIPQNLSVLDSGGSGVFEHAALEAAREWRFKPANLDGTPSWQSNNQVVVIFALEGTEKGASRKFTRNHRRLGELIDSGDLDEADELFQQMYADDDLNLYAMGRLWTQRVSYEMARSDYSRANLAIYRATVSTGQWIEKESYAGLLAARISIELYLGLYAEALEAYDALVELTGAESDVAREAKPRIDKLRELIDSDKTIKTQAEVRRRGECYRCNDSYAFSPVRRQFAFADVNGELTSIELRCTHRRFESPISDLVEWKIPESWGECSIQVKGDPGTTFSVLQFPET